jgi:cellulose synthase/poly-beta-1,6-N-acetylglucosamine synthase-like glycosyltransferase
MSSSTDSDNHSIKNLTENLAAPEKLVPEEAFDIDREKQELAYFISIGISPDSLQSAVIASRRNFTTIQEEVFASGLLNEEAHFHKLAKRLNLPFLNQIDANMVVGSQYIDVLLKRRGPLRIVEQEVIRTVVSPNISEVIRLNDHLIEKPELQNRLAIASFQTIKHTVWQFRKKERVKDTIRELPENSPEMSARHLMTNWQSFVCGFALSCFLFFASASTSLTMTVFHTFLSLLYLSSNLLKLAAAFFTADETNHTTTIGNQPLPMYTILVALYDEAPVARQLVRALDRLNWPKSRLDIKLICEENDTATIEAIKAANPGSQFEIVTVPPMPPSTKPKALQYALHGAGGDFIAIYDAEDIPNPDQLREAYSVFSTSDNKLACLQAPLVISNAPKNWLTALFGIEYSGLFRRLIPLLSYFGLPIPLGGTSNHFRRSALKAVGGWDPNNVTEDADLGIRLYRHGYHTGVLRRPTLEHAPEDIDVWIKQRTRWLKGWMQTWLVFMRRPLNLFKQNKIIGFLSLQIIIAGMLVAALAHPFAYLFISHSIYTGVTYGTGAITNTDKFLFFIDVFNLFGSYFIFFLAGWRAFIPLEKRDIKKKWLLMLPFYWLLMSWAGWRAITQLPNQAHKWEKTPHQPVQSKLIPEK